MRAFKFKIIKKKFPFLWDLIAEYQPQDVTVEKAGIEILERVGWSNKYYSSLADFVEYEIYFVFDGNQLHRVPSRGTYAEGNGYRDEWEGVSVGELCYEENLKPEIVVGLSRTENDSCGNGTASILMTIYQLIDINWEEYFERKLNQAEQELGL
jgi:hypothetical protein